MTWYDEWCALDGMKIPSKGLSVRQQVARVFVRSFNNFRESIKSTGCIVSGIKNDPLVIIEEVTWVKRDSIRLF